MDLFVVYISDSEAHKDLLFVVPMETTAITAVRFLNDQAMDAKFEDYPYIQQWLATQGIDIHISKLKSVGRYGEYFKYEKIQYITGIDYDVLPIVQASNWWDEYDHFTSDYEPDYEPISDEDFYDWHFDHEHGVWGSVDLKHLKNANKLREFVKHGNNHKRYDPKFNHPDVKEHLHQYESCSTWANNAGYRKAENKITRLISKHVRNGGCMASTLVYKLKNTDDYKHCAIFRHAAKRYIDALEQPQNFSWITHWEWCMGEYVYHNGCVMNKADAHKYWGYEEVCEICGKDHAK